MAALLAPAPLSCLRLRSLIAPSWSRLSILFVIARSMHSPSLRLRGFLPTTTTHSSSTPFTNATKRQPMRESFASSFRWMISTESALNCSFTILITASILSLSATVDPVSICATRPRFPCQTMAAPSEFFRARQALGGSRSATTLLRKTSCVGSVINSHDHASARRRRVCQQHQSILPSVLGGHTSVLPHSQTRRDVRRHHFPSYLGPCSYRLLPNRSGSAVKNL